MDATELLKRDHQEIRHLFARYEDLDVEDRAAKASLFRRIRDEIEVHAAVEEEIFYPAMRTANPVLAGPIIREAYEDHRLIRQILRDLGSGEPGSDEFDAKFAVLRENVLRHVEEEEREVFEEARSSMTPLQLRLLSGRILDRRREIGGRARRPVRVLAGARRVLSHVRRAVSQALRRSGGGSAGRVRRSVARSRRS